jgi:6-phosphogluconolactonase
MVQVFDNIQALSQKAALLFVEAAQEAIRARGRFTVALTGGSSPVQLYELLTKAPYKDQLPWQDTYVFWGDERWVPLTDEQSNARMAFDALLNKVPVPKEQIFPMWGESEPDAFARHYEELLHKQLGPGEPAFDLVLLGMGEDGHTASLFPGTDVLHEKERLVEAYYLPGQDMYRITLTAPLINRARQVVFLAFGEKKAKALAEVLKGEPDPEMYPAQLIQPEKREPQWLVDTAAARLLHLK